MSILFIDGSPNKEGNTAKLAEKLLAAVSRGCTVWSMSEWQRTVRKRKEWRRNYKQKSEET